MDEITLINRRAWIGSGLVLAAATFNTGLCFVNTHVLPISVTHVIACEVAIISLAAAVSYRVITAETSILVSVVAAYFCLIWLVSGKVNAKIARDLLIPFVFLSCGAACAGPRAADRLVYYLILTVFSAAIFEWFWLDRFLEVFDIFNYYVAKGRIDDSQRWMDDIDLAMNGMRLEDEGRTLFPVLGLHRVSSVFLEPISAGYFAVIVFAWLLVRFRIAPLRNLAFITLAAAIIIMTDSRFAAVACLVLVIAWMLPLLPKVLLWLLPFALILGLIGYAAMSPIQGLDQSFNGRVVWSGRLIAGFDIDQWFGIDHGLAQATLENLDSGYAYAIYAVGLPGLVVLWTAFCFARDQALDGARYRVLLALYFSFALIVGEAAFSIKTAALAWFLLGASQNSGAVLCAARRPSVSRLQPSSTSSWTTSSLG